MMVRVKVCGVTNLDDALAATAAGADAVGLVLAESPRQVSPEAARKICRALPPLVSKVGVVVDGPPERAAELIQFCGLDYVQLHGAESEEQVAALKPRAIKALAMGDDPPDPSAYPGAPLLLDSAAGGGSGRSFDWRLAREIADKRPVILAGGLNPDNVAAAIQAVRPFAVDVSSGVESRPGRKDHAKLEQFVRRAGRALGA